MTATPPIRYVTAADGTRISYMCEPGESPPFLFAYTPGSPHLALKAARGYDGYLRYIREFARERAWFCLDWRGTGVSGPIKGTLTLEDLVADLDIITGMIGESVDAWTPGSGAMVVCSHAAAQPDRYRSIWLRSPVVAGEQWSVKLRNRPGWEANYREHLRQFMVGNSVPLVVAARFAAEWELGVPQTSFAAYRAAEAADIRPALDRVHTPVWVTAGIEPDEGVAAEIAALLPDATLSLWRSESMQTTLGDWTREDWDRNLGSRVGDAMLTSRLPPSANTANGLSPRELEVLCLLAAGKSNRQIAETLVLSNATVATHVRHILEKTGSANRTQAANWARDHGVL